MMGNFSAMLPVDNNTSPHLALCDREHHWYPNKYGPSLGMDSTFSVDAIYCFL